MTAGGRRSENRDAELLRSVFVVPSGALAFGVAVVLLWKLRRINGLLKPVPTVGVDENPIPEGGLSSLPEP